MRDVEWVIESLDYLRAHHFDTIEPTGETEDARIDHANKLAEYTLYSAVNSWYNERNILKIFRHYVVGFYMNREKGK